eukprot:PLAT9237.1.p1 GENE.PLAT9237.1~~PLAT9237.1.p1  ORF type:complete len:312 (+),score=153.45 PLAT9237.1:69-1004(+)
MPAPSCRKSALLLLVVTLASCASAFPTGMPNCDAVAPYSPHAQSQLGYTLTVTPTTAALGDVVTVTVSGPGPVGGIFLYGVNGAAGVATLRDRPGNFVVNGDFKEVTEGGARCTQTPGASTITSSRGDPKQVPASFQYVLPSDPAQLSDTGMRFYGVVVPPAVGGTPQYRDLQPVTVTITNLDGSPLAGSGASGSTNNVNGDTGEGASDGIAAQLGMSNALFVLVVIGVVVFVLALLFGSCARSKRRTVVVRQPQPAPMMAMAPMTYSYAASAAPAPAAYTSAPAAYAAAPAAYTSTPAAYTSAAAPAAYY